ncbi:hypothetical protein PAXINDRAFT_180392 [Paxillus involutus ATCC 200175]|nr:hypothetical protein PAXINDRAFT_180392 [Paxillus involutus ATCC 200175]
MFAFGHERMQSIVSFSRRHLHQNLLDLSSGGVAIVTVLRKGRWCPFKHSNKENLGTDSPEVADVADEGQQTLVAWWVVAHACQVGTLLDTLEIARSTWRSASRERCFYFKHDAQHMTAQGRKVFREYQITRIKSRTILLSSRYNAQERYV